MPSNFHKIVVAAALLVAAWVPARAEVKIAAGSSWVNGDGSVLTVTEIGPKGQLTGTMTTSVGCGAKQPQPITGWYYPGRGGGAISFSVHWSGCNSVTTWLGQYNSATGHFQALWYLAMASAPTWNGILAGSHVFVPQPANKNK